MTESCIVCLGDLTDTIPPGIDHDGPSTSDTGTATSLDPSSISTPAVLTKDLTDDPDAIAFLLPCHHYLHNDCLKPWVERANSCPICRQSFNVVELKEYLHGPAVSSYVVQDKQQQPEIDPTMVVEDDLSEDLFGQNESMDYCMLCEQEDSQEELLLCDGCTAACHIPCAGLDEVPAGTWYCQFCREDTAVRPQYARASRIRRAGQNQRRPRQRRQNPHTDSWARVWQTVWDQLNIDLDFPFDDDLDLDQRTEAQRREFGEWQRRFHVAEHQGAAVRFRDTAATILGRSQEQRRPESQDEIRAWNAYDKAREIEENGGSRSLKRKSPTASPTDPPTEPERRLKRPRTRRKQDIELQTASSAAEETSRIGLDGPLNANYRQSRDSISGGPSFFQSLLLEVENGSTSLKDSTSRQRSMNRPNASLRTRDSRPSLSTAVSPSSSNISSPRPRSLSPTSRSSSRPASPPLTSRIDPVFVQQPAQTLRNNVANEVHEPRQDDSDCQSDAILSPAVSPDEHREEQVLANSPTHSRNIMTFSAKEDVQSMVRAALKPAYKKGVINTEEYTKINKEVSRNLYDLVGEAGGLSDEQERSRWQSFAKRQVQTAMKRLKEMDAAVSA